MAEKNDRLAKLIDRRKLDIDKFEGSAERAEFYALVRELGFRTANGQCCICDNGYGCNPDSPPPGCGTCSCYQCP